MNESLGGAQFRGIAARRSRGSPLTLSAEFCFNFPSRYLFAIGTPVAAVKSSVELTITLLNFRLHVQATLLTRNMIEYLKPDRWYAMYSKNAGSHGVLTL